MSFKLLVGAHLKARSENIEPTVDLIAVRLSVTGTFSNLRNHVPCTSIGVKNPCPVILVDVQERSDGCVRVCSVPNSLH